jgi:outer membrane protein assembly factor BamD
MNKWVVLLSLVGTVALPVGCVDGKKTPRTAAEYQDEARRAYDDAMAEYHAGNWEFATQKFTELRNNYPNTPYALKAQLRAADVLHEQGRYPDAVALYDTYVSEHPTDADVAYARFRAIEGQVESSSNSIFQPPLEERDLANVQEAYNDIRSFEADYPNYGEPERLAFLRRSVSGMLVRHELYVARFYLRTDHFEAAQRRVQYALRNYAGTGLDPEAVVLLGEIYLKQKQLDQAEALFQHVLAKFPESEFRVPAERFLASMEERKKKTPNTSP